MCTNFIAGKPVTGKNLIGRENEIKQISNYLKNGDSVVLIAPRRFGKTSIILEVLERLSSDDYFTGYIDLFTTPSKLILSEEITNAVLANKKLDNFVAVLKNKFSEILKNIEFKHILENFEFVLEFRNENVDEYKLLKNSLGFIDGFSKKHNNSIVMAFDEFADIDKLNGKELAKLFRSTIQLHKNSSYIFSGSYESMMKNIFIKKNSPFYRFARIIEIGFIDKKSFSAYLKKQFKKMKIEVNQNTIAKIIDITKGHPYYTQLMAQIISFLKPVSIQEKDIQGFLKESLQLEKSYFESVWSEISKSKENTEVILCIADGISPYKKLNSKSINVARAINNLKEKGLLTKDKTGIVFYDIFLLYWLQINILKLKLDF